MRFLRSKRVLISVGVIAAILVLLGSAVSYFFSEAANDLEEEVFSEAHQYYESYSDLFFSDQQYLYHHEINFNTPDRGRDAGPWLNTQLQWRGKILRNSSGDRDLLSYSEGLKELARDWQGNWEELKQQSGDLDFSWLRELQVYDYWEVDQNSPIEDWLREDRNHPVHLDPVPETPWGYVATLRLAQASSTGELTQAAEELRHLVRILFSTEHLMQAVFAVSILQRERSIYEYLNTEGVLRNSKWEPLSGDYIERLRRYIYAYSQYFSFLTPIDQLRKAFENKNYIGYCVGLREGMYYSLPFRIVIKNEYPEHWETMTNIIKDSEERCRLKRFRQLWGDPDYESSILSHTLFKPFDPYKWFKINRVYHWPMFSGMARSAIYSVLMDRPNFFYLYEE